MSSVRQFYLYHIDKMNIDVLCNINTHICIEHKIGMKNSKIDSIDLIEEHKIIKFKEGMINMINHENVFAMHNLALYYDIVENNVGMMLKYYKMAASNKDIYSMHQMILACKRRNIRYDLIKKYSLKIIDKYNKIATKRGLRHHEISDLHKACYSIGELYGKEKRYDDMEKYMLVAIKNNALYFKKFKEDSVKCAKYMASHYKNNSSEYTKQKAEDETIKYYSLAIDMDDVESMNDLANYLNNVVCDFEKAKKYYVMAGEHGCYSPQMDEAPNKKIKTAT